MNAHTVVSLRLMTFKKREFGTFSVLPLRKYFFRTSKEMSCEELQFPHES